ncbi:hypothetical protein EV384_4038 [Micromonospora kangleipakensis]|uniref:Uncharacterized protein n=1 Tax=Micromonospora kangleipakensis TaxID=1077942 RepID=A0A4Q8BCB5_9ACTN|nr:hypothetical protein [Micromonospora kangleipakensis]RZU75494.1 hypothetical protein EV384_4038 [Micromonospora kangleipakensis]
MTDPISPAPSDQPADSPQSAVPSYPAPQFPPTPGAAVPSTDAPYPSGATPGGITLPTRRSKTRAYAVGGVALVIALCCGGIGIAALTGGDAEAPAQASASASATPSSAAPTTAAPTTAAPTTAAAPTVAAYDTPTKKDFKLAVKILRKKCFGSAGCNLTYRIDVTYTGSGLDPSKTYEVTYEVRGGEDPMVNTFEVTGDTASVQQEEDGGTKRSGDKLTAVVTDVAEL